MENPITNKNSTLRKLIADGYPWLPIKNVSKKFGIEPSILKREALEGRIRITQEQKAKKLYTMFYQPNIQKYVDHLKDRVTFLKASILLGVTKPQLVQLLNANRFTYVCSPKESNSQVWVFSRQEISTYLRIIFYRISKIDSDFIPLPKNMKIISNRVINPLAALLSLIQMESCLLHSYQIESLI